MNCFHVCSLCDDENNEADNAAEGNHYLGESSHYVDFHAINSLKDTYNYNMTGLEANPMFINVKINEKIVNMEIDTGSYFAVMSEGFVKNNLNDLKVSNSTAHLLGYEDNTMTPLGQLENLKVTFNGKTEMLSSLILKGDTVPLIGQQWLKAPGLWPLSVCNKSDTSAKIEKDLNKIDVNNVRENLLKFKELFSDTSGVYNKREVKLHMKQNTRPAAFPALHT